MRQTAQRGFYSPQYDRHVGIKSFQDLAVHYRGIFRTKVVPPVRRICVLAPQAAVGRVFVHHRIHAAGSHTEPQARPSQFLEIAEITVPVRLGNNRHPVAFGFQNAPDDSRTERRMIHVGISGEQDNVHIIPSPQLHFFFGRGEPVSQTEIFHQGLLFLYSANTFACSIS